MLLQKIKRKNFQRNKKVWVSSPAPPPKKKEKEKQKSKKSKHPCIAFLFKK
jgi:hypothetical protein